MGAQYKTNMKSPPLDAATFILLADGRERRMQSMGTLQHKTREETQTMRRGMGMSLNTKRNEIKWNGMTRAHREGSAQRGTHIFLGDIYSPSGFWECGARRRGKGNGGLRDAPCGQYQRGHIILPRGNSIDHSSFALSPGPHPQALTNHKWLFDI